jgi:glycerate 2-kinase
MNADQRRKELLTIYQAALQAVNGRAAVRQHLQTQPINGACTLIAIGKAAEAMTLGACDALPGGIHGGLVISKPGHFAAEALAARGFATCAGGHPLPTPGSLEAGQRLLELLRGTTEKRLLFLISGGASSLVESPLAGLSLTDLERAGTWLLGSGLGIEAMNHVRKSLSGIKGGGLLQLIGERSVTALAISDVPGDDPAVIGSGLLVPDGGLANKVRQLALPDWLRAWVEQGLAQRRGLPASAPEIAIVASLEQAKAAAARQAEQLGHAVITHTEFVAGDAAKAGQRLAGALLLGPPGVHVWGGETTVRLPAQPGRGGRNQHLALAAALTLNGHADCALLSAGTDGSDGPTEDCGAVVDGGTLERAAALGRRADAALASADAGTFLAASGDLLQSGPTGTNVMDLILGLKQQRLTA